MAVPDVRRVRTGSVSPGPCNREEQGLPEAAIIAAQSAGGSIGNAIAPANVVLGTSTVGIRGQEGAILRKTIPWTLVAVVVTGIATVLLVLFTGSGTGPARP
jgi:L-lactate permease